MDGFDEGDQHRVTGTGLSNVTYLKNGARRIH